MHVFVLIAHSMVRWAVLGLGVFALVRMTAGVVRETAWTTMDRRSLVMFVGILDLQLLLGLILFATSPIIREALHDVGAAMGTPALRFFLAEHPLTMVGAVAIAHVGSVIARRAPNDAVRFRRAAFSVALSLGLLLAGIPWGRLIPG